MSLEQTLSLLEAITDLQDLCLMHVGIFSGPRTSEVMGFQWKSWTGVSLPHGTAYEGQFYKGRFKSKASRAPISPFVVVIPLFGVVLIRHMPKLPIACSAYLHFECLCPRSSSLSINRKYKQKSEQDSGVKC